VRFGIKMRSCFLSEIFADSGSALDSGRGPFHYVALSSRMSNLPQIGLGKRSAEPLGTASIKYIEGWPQNPAVTTRRPNLRVPWSAWTAGKTENGTSVRTAANKTEEFCIQVRRARKSAMTE
jgi:hypothetical protein